MISSEAWMMISALAATVSSLAVYINRQSTKRIGQLEAENAKLQERLDATSSRTLSTSETLERVVNAALEREKVLTLQAADRIRQGETHQ